MNGQIIAKDYLQSHPLSTGFHTRDSWRAFLAYTRLSFDSPTWEDLTNYVYEPGMNWTSFVQKNGLEVQ